MVIFWINKINPPLFTAMPRNSTQSMLWSSDLMLPPAYMSLVTPDLKTLDTFGNFKDQSSHLVYLEITNLLDSIGCRSCEIIMKEKTPLSLKVVCFQMLDFGTSKSNFEALKSNSWKVTSFSKTMSPQREPFLTMFYTINSLGSCLCQ